jgi:hypothetical protein
MTVTETVAKLPAGERTERELISAILFGHEGAPVIFTLLRPESFTVPSYRVIFAAAKELHDRGEPSDAVAVADKMQPADLEAIGGPQVLAEISSGMFSKYDVAHACKIVSRKARQRQLIFLSEKLQKDAWEDNADPDALAETLAQDAAAIRASNEAAAWREMFDSWAEFEEAQPLSFAIKGFLQNDAATIIGGLAGQGKTLMLLSAAKALLIGKGHKLWNTFEVEEEEPARVMYLIPESSRVPFKHRLKLFGIYPYLAPDSERLTVRTLSKGPAPSLSDPRILQAANGSHVLLDTAVRFGEWDENDVDRALGNNIVALLSAGARSVLAAHHAPKSFTKETVMTLENVLRGNGDIGAVFATGWGIKQLDEPSNTIHVENIKARDFEPCGPFQIIGRPYIHESGDFRILKRPGECGPLQDELPTPERDRGGAPIQAREAKAANKELLRGWLSVNPLLNSQELSQRFYKLGIKLGDSSIRKYRKELGL